MSTLNGKRVVAGGVVAAVVALVGEMVLEPLAGSHMEAWLGGLGFEPPGEALMVAYLVTTLVLGILVVWLYALARPRFGAGPRAAVAIGLAAWAFACLIPGIHMFALGVMPADVFWITTAFSAVQVPAATLAGAWVYREKPHGAGAPAAAHRHAHV